MPNEYDRAAAVAYARKWALSRNPDFYNFDSLGGDCTNFASQCIYAGAKVMNYTPTFGWFYRSAGDRTPSWTGVQYLWNFLINNKGAGPYAEEAPITALEAGDIVQLGTATDDYYHSPVVIGRRGDAIFVAAHSYDCLGRPLSSYTFAKARGIHILGVRPE